MIQFMCRSHGFRAPPVLFALLLSACGAAVAPNGDGGQDGTFSDAGGCLLSNGTICALGRSCPAGDGCNTCTCPATGGSALCTRLACVPNDAAPPGCRSAADCSRGQQCVFTVGACDAPGSCQAAAPCSESVEYCGCDGRSYLACVPTRPTQRTGSCEGADAGPGGCWSASDCASGAQECVFPEGACAAPGRCMGITDCAMIAPYCSCDGMTFMDCPGRPTRPNVGRGACTITVDAGVADAGICAGAHFGRGGGACVGPDDAPRPPECCTDWNCDTVHSMILCGSIMPPCAAGTVNTVLSGCWGPCVPPRNCAVMRCPDGRCPGGFVCDSGSLTCTAR